MATEYTVVFFGHPRDIKGNPFDVVSEFGKVCVLSVGNACETEERLREALEQIVDEGGDGPEAKIAQDALDAADAALMASIKAGAA